MAIFSKMTPEEATNEFIKACKNDLGLYSKFEFLEEDKVNKISINDQDCMGTTALMYASARGEIEICRKLIALKCNLDIQNNVGYTAFMYACFKHQVPVAMLLIEAGCDFSLVENSGRTGMDMLNGHDQTKEIQVIYLNCICLFGTHQHH